jgi:alpha-galactosidase
MPYFTLDWGGTGMVVAIGWPGQWAVDMIRDGGSALHLRAGMISGQPAAGTSILQAGPLDSHLLSGEQVRTPLIVTQSWACGGWIDAQNAWRRWMLAHNTRTLAGAPDLAPIASTGVTCGYFPGLLDSAADELQFLAAHRANGTLAGQGGVSDYWWMDAGWYDLPAGATDWTAVGTWIPDPDRYPDGLRAVTDPARANGLRAIVWHEPERVTAGTDLATNHPSWLLPASGGNMLLDLGNPAAWSWAATTFSGLITDSGVGLYRQDFNMAPLDSWNAADTANRTGMTQVKYVMGYLAFWDRLLSDHPNLLIDSCASGGRRNDVETLRRAVPLLRSDFQFEPASQQNHLYGLSLFVPFQGTGVGPGPEYVGSHGTPEYVMRSCYAPGYTTAVNALTATPTQWETLRRITAEWQQIAPSLLGDYYPLTDYSTAQNVWMAMQFDRPGTADGVILAYRRPSNGAGTLSVSPRGIDTGADYLVEDYGAGTSRTLSGSALAGLTIALDPGAATAIRYRKVTSHAALLAAAEPAGWWRLGEGSGSGTVADSSGNGLTGSASGVAFGAPAAIAGDTDTAAGFDGSSSHINLGNPTALQLTTCSVEAWVQTTNTAHAGQAVAIKWYAWGLFLAVGVPALYDWHADVRHQCGTDAFVADGQWHHVVLTFQNAVTNATRIYVDGELRLTTTVTIQNNDHQVIIGAGNIPATTDWYTGTIDEVAIYPRLLTAGEIATHHRAGTG